MGLRVGYELKRAQHALRLVTDEVARNTASRRRSIRRSTRSAEIRACMARLSLAPASSLLRRCISFSSAWSEVD